MNYNIQQLKETIDAIQACGGNKTEAAKLLKIPRSTLRERYRTAMSYDISSQTDDTLVLQEKIKTLLNDKSKLKDSYDELSRRYRELEQQLGMVNIFQSSVKDINVKPIIIEKENKLSESTAVALLSDIHFEEVIDPRTIDGLNEHNIKISKQRIKTFFQNVLKLIYMSRSKSKINNLVLWLGGDLISGHIHDESTEINELSPIDSCIELFSVLVSGIEFLLENGEFNRLTIPVNVGNHGRTTQKKRHATSVQNNYEWMIYNFLDLYFQQNKIIQFQLTRGYFNYLRVYNRFLRFHHGDNVRYQGGVGGIMIPLNKAVAQWNKAKQADLDILGHWHQRLSARNIVVNGSTVGYNPFAISIKAEFEPPQQSFFLLHSEKGKTVEAPIWVE